MHRKTRKRDHRWESNPGPQQFVLRAITPTPPLDRNLDTNFSYAYISLVAYCYYVCIFDMVSRDSRKSNRFGVEIKNTKRLQKTNHNKSFFSFFY
uniref:Uncharacterized protein n=1 Tax=Picea sitchensis TaxID=3332 RepID=B8LNV2_PICSI|nr:unknown [Picea sitchensis]